MVIYFTGTGSSQYVAEAVADRLDDEVVSANSIIKNGQKLSFTDDDSKPWVFVFPIYLSTMPAIFMDLIGRTEFKGSKKAYFVGCCASSVGSAANRCVKICREKDWEYMGIAKVQMPQNYIALFRMTEPDEIDRRLSAALVTADEVSRAISEGRQLDMNLSSKAENAVVLLVEKMYNGPFTGTKKFYVTEKCIGCGACAKNCPMNRIEFEKTGRPVWTGSCIHCMACINRCPKQAIEYGTKTIGKRRYVCRRYKKEN